MVNCDEPNSQHSNRLSLILDAIARQVKNFDVKFYHKDPWHVQVFESEKVQQLADLKRRELIQWFGHFY